MMDFLRDPIWQFIGAVLALIALFVSIYLFVLQRRKKTLAYEILSETKLLTMKEGFEGKVQILFEGQSVKNVHLLVIKIINNGNIPIASSDFEKALTFAFNEDVNILSAEIIDTYPKTLKPMIDTNQNRLVLNPTLLNSGDSITFKLLLTQYDGKIEVDTRIIGVSEVKKATEQRTQSLYYLIAGTIITLVGLVGFVVRSSVSALKIQDNVPKNILDIPSFVVITFGYILMFYAIFRSRKSRNSFQKYIMKSEAEVKK